MNHATYLAWNVQILYVIIIVQILYLIILLLFWSTHPTTLPTNPGEHKKALLKTGYPLTALSSSCMLSFCIPKFISFILDLPSSSTHIVHGNVNLISVINTVYYAISDNIAPSYSRATYRNFLLSPCSPFIQEEDRLNVSWYADIFLQVLQRPQLVEG